MMKVIKLLLLKMLCTGTSPSGTTCINRLSLLLFDNLLLLELLLLILLLLNVLG